MNISNINSEELKEINNFIEEGFCPIIYSKIFDTDELLSYPSVEKVKLKIKNIVEPILCNDINKEKCNILIEQLTKNFIPAGTKGVVWGNLFNKEIKLLIQNILLKFTNLECKFEENPKQKQLSEIPDWYIINTKTNKILVGYNQLDLWNGGHQSNRASKYVKNDNMHIEYKKQNIKIISIVCRKTKIKSSKNKTFSLFKCGIEKERLFYPIQIENYIMKYFNL